MNLHCSLHCIWEWTAYWVKYLEEEGDVRTELMPSGLDILRHSVVLSPPHPGLFYLNSSDILAVYLEFICSCWYFVFSSNSVRLLPQLVFLFHCALVLLANRLCKMKQQAHRWIHLFSRYHFLINVGIFYSLHCFIVKFSEEY